ncbi:hypothetical protein J6590_001711 [Homalodisca vitripennis]|nr:hypothetical protein J6590_001711 [Homalodisca vitripennis]
MGDININCLIPERDGIKLDKMLRSHNMTRMSLPPTRITPTSQTSIDCVCTNLEEMKISVQVIDVGISDHTAQFCKVVCQQFETRKPVSERRNSSENNLLAIKARLGQESWCDVLAVPDIDSAYNLFSNTSEEKKKNRITDEEAERLTKDFLRAQTLYNTTGNL